MEYRSRLNKKFKIDNTILPLSTILIFDFGIVSWYLFFFLIIFRNYFFGCFIFVRSNGLLHWLMVFNATFFNISVISWRPFLLVEETGVPEESTDLSQVTDELYHKVWNKYNSPEQHSNSQL